MATTYTGLIGTNLFNGFGGGSSVTPGRGDKWAITAGGFPLSSDEYAFDIVTASQTIVLGAGDVIGTSPVACLNLANRVHFVAGNRWSFSGLNDPTGFEQQSVGAGYIDMANNFAQAEPLTGIAQYQGKMALFARGSVQIWQVDANPLNFQQLQVIPNTGTFAPNSVQAIGDLDVIYLYDTGVRSLRVRDSSLYAVTLDIGTPIDTLVQADILALGALKSKACAAFEPSGGRYWMFLNGTIYVLSYYPSSKIVAWSTYKTTWNNAGVQTAFIPVKFENYSGQTFCTDSTAVYAYGGSTGGTYDNSVATVVTPLYDLKSPATLKKASSIDVAIKGTWAVSFGMNEQVPSSVNTAYTGNKSTFPYGTMGVQGDGYHFKFKAQTTQAEAAVLSSLIFHYKQANEK